MGFFAGGREPAWAMLRREFDLDSVPEHAFARLAVDSRYVLYVNGEEQARGPARGNLRRLRYDVVDLASALVPGRNVIAILARYFAHENAWWAPVPVAGQLGAGALAFELALPGSWIVSDDDEWRALPGRAWVDLVADGVAAMPSECCDAREFPADWTSVDFDHSQWAAALALKTNSMGFSGDVHPPSQPYGPLPQRTLSILGCEDRAAQRLVSLGAWPIDETLDARPPFEHVMHYATSDLPERSGEGRELSSFQSEVAAGVGFPIVIEACSNGVEVVLADFGEVIVGSVYFEIEAPTGTRIDAAAVERLDSEGCPAPSGEEAGFRYWARGEADVYETASVYGLRALAISIQSTGPVTIRKIGVRERTYPRPDGCYFECSDELLNRVYQVGRRSVDLCSQDAYIDCPTREQRAWTGDAVVHQMVDLASNPDWGLARWNVEMAASPRADGMLPMALAGDIEVQDRTFIPDYSLHWIHSLHNLYRYTGDRELIGRLLPVAERVLRWFDDFTTRDGLLSNVTSWVLIDWSSIHVSGKSSALNALYARALRDFEEMSEWMKDLGRSEWARNRHRRLEEGFELFWDEARSLYVDHVVAGERGRPVSQHGQATALVGDLVPRDRQAALAESMMADDRLVHAAWQMPNGDSRFPLEGEGLLSAGYLYKGPPPPWWDVENEIVRAQPFFLYVVHDALALVGREDLILNSCRQWKALLDRCPTSLSETWWGGTTCHGWSSTPTRDLVTRILGISPVAPGFDRVRIAPKLGDLAWAHAAAPTPSGLVHVRVEDDEIEIESPVEIELTLASSPMRVLLAGRHQIALRKGSDDV